MLSLIAVLTTAMLSAGNAMPAPASTSGKAYAALKYGVYMHFGLATYVGISPNKYDPHDYSAKLFNPTDFDPDQWMRAAAASGAKYAVFTTKHHDGFTMWPSATTDWGVESSSRPDLDAVGEFVAAARRHGLKVGLYYSWLDKWHPGGKVKDQQPSAEYIAYAKQQLRELLTNYGDVIALYLDAPDHADEAKMAEFVQEISPETAFIWKRPWAYSAEDVHGYEELQQRDAAIKNTCQFPGPTESYWNVSGGVASWQSTDNPPQTDAANARAEISYTNMLGSTLSLNISPGRNGKLPAASVDLLKEIGTTKLPPAFTLANGKRVYDDGAGKTMRCGRADGIRFEGTWQANAQATAYQGTVHTSATANSSAVLSFTGTRAELRANAGPSSGIATISIDGGTPTRVDLYRTSSQQITWRSQPLSSAHHSIKVVVTGTRNSASSGNSIAVDALTVTQ
ncbi:alpha-L-fucosidase [Microlunatus sp. GCM10028923]|uniref:alpha-L-fucosidase n=1 Tax=Microlunatus sp. GCM10028923 TaxID=3273400 RepID=UPI0036086E5B